MRTIHVNITGMFVQKDCKNGGVQGEGNATQLHITFDETWKGYGKRVIWRNAQGENPVAVVLIAAAAAGTADTLTYDTPIPAEALALPGWCSFTVEGFQDAETASAMFSVRDVLQVMENDGANSPAEPTPSESQQILDAIAKNEEAVGAYAKESKSWAVGGTESREGEDTDNAMYYAQQAEASRKDASESAKSASVSAGSAAASAAAAAGSKAAADKSAGVAKDSAILSQSWAVGDTGTREGENTDNARYWAKQAHMAAGGGVVSFNGRTGSVIPKKGDYTAADVGAPALDDNGKIKLSDLPLLQVDTYLIVSFSSGSPDGSNGKFSTIQAALDSLPKDLCRYKVMITVQDSDPEEDVLITGFFGNRIFSPQTSDARFVGIYFDFLNGSTIRSLRIVNNQVPCILIKNAVVSGGLPEKWQDVPAGICVLVQGCPHVELSGCTVKNGTVGVEAGSYYTSGGSTVFLDGGTVGDCSEVALFAEGQNSIFGENVSGDNNAIALRAYYGARVVKRSGTLTGTTMQSIFGGFIDTF